MQFALVVDGLEMYLLFAGDILQPPIDCSARLLAIVAQRRRSFNRLLRVFSMRKWRLFNRNNSTNCARSIQIS